jgi:hypothetical protein
VSRAHAAKINRKLPNRDAFCGSQEATLLRHPRNPQAVILRCSDCGLRHIAGRIAICGVSVAVFQGWIREASRRPVNGGCFSGVRFKLDNNVMKTKTRIVLVLGVSSLAVLPSMAGVGVGVQINVPAPAVVVPAPAVTVEAVPDNYVWDGSEYVGVVGSQYYYLGPNNVWLTLDGPRVARFHTWETAHADWRLHAIRNERYRHDAHGHDVPFHDAHDGDGGAHGHDGGH